jgi:hypothetical protein
MKPRSHYRRRVPGELRVTFSSTRVAPVTLQKLNAWRKPNESWGQLIDRLVDRLL